ncbi:MULTISPECIES: DUF1643 domain-containing protein [Levilactobacillus]|nr:DUF1643 domain-containing protein [Levilactobacillus sp. 244-2]
MENYSDFNYVGTGSDEDDKFRYFLELKNKNYSQIGHSKLAPTLVALMQHPSDATVEKSDPTVNNVLRGQGREYRKIIIVNLVPMRGKCEFSSKKYKKLIESKKSENCKVVNKIIKEETNFDFLVATGNNASRVASQYNGLIDIIQSYSPKKSFVIGLSKSGYGYLPSNANRPATKHLTLVHMHNNNSEWTLEKVIN